MVSSALGAEEPPSALAAATSGFRIQTAKEARLHPTRGPLPTPAPSWTAHTNLEKETQEVQDTRRPSSGPSRRSTKAEAMNTWENLSDRKSGEAPPPRNDKHTVKRQRPKRQPETNRQRSDNTPLETTISYMHLVRIMENEIKDCDQTVQHLSHYIPSKEGGSHRDQYNKPTPQREKTVRHRPTVSADEKKGGNPRDTRLSTSSLTH